MPRTVRLRPWQQAALEAFESTPGSDFLAVATPGAGKTTFALTAARRELARRPSRLIVLAPTAHLKTQWADAADHLDLALEPDWSPGDGALPADMHGIVTTYQQVASAAPALARLSRGAMVILDELHHAGDDRAWGDSVRTAFEPAARRLALSGTPFRSDTQAIPFVRYVADRATPDFEYGYRQALADHAVVRPVYFPRTDGQMEWSTPGGEVVSATFGDHLDRSATAQRLRTALSPEGDWLSEVLASADERLTELRADQPEAGGLVIATDQDHARSIARLIRDHLGHRAAVITSDDAGASERLERFARGSERWLVAVRMVSEGVDIPRLRIGVYATTTTTELFFRQAVGRLVRWQAGLGTQPAYLFIPDDHRLRRLAFRIAEARHHQLVRTGEAGEPGDDGEDPRAMAETAGGAGGADQLSLFAPISAVATDHDQLEAAGAATPGASASAGSEAAEDPRLELVLDPPPPIHGAGSAQAVATGADRPAGAGAPTPRHLHKGQLRRANAQAARELVHRTGLGHAQINAELNRLTGLRGVTGATAEELERRLGHADRWLRR